MPLLNSLSGCRFCLDDCYLCRLSSEHENTRFVAAPSDGKGLYGCYATAPSSHADLCVLFPVALRGCWSLAGLKHQHSALKHQHAGQNAALGGRRVVRGHQVQAYWGPEQPDLRGFGGFSQSQRDWAVP